MTFRGKKLLSVVSSSVILVLATASTAHGAELTVFQGKATIIHVGDELEGGPINVNDIVRVRWSQPSLATDMDEDPKFGRYESIEVQFELSGILGLSNTCSVKVFDAAPDGGEGDIIYLSCNSFTVQPSPINGYGLTTFTVRLDDVTGAAINDDSLPSTLNLSDWASSQVSLWYNNASGVPSLISGNFTSLTSSDSGSGSTSSPAPTPPPEVTTPIEPTILSSPNGVHIVSTSADSIALSWESVAGAVGYVIYRSASASGPFEQITATPMSDTSYTDTNVSPSSTYYYQVSAVSEEDIESKHSEVLLVSTAGQVIAALPTQPPTGSATSNVGLWVIGVIPAVATAVAVLWKKGVFHGRTTMETVTAIESQTITPAWTEINLTNKNIGNMSPSVAREPSLFTTSTVVAGQSMEPKIKREFIEVEIEPDPTEGKITSELKSEPDSKPKKYSEAADKEQDAKAAKKYRDKAKKYVGGARKQGQRARKRFRAAKKLASS